MSLAIAIDIGGTSIKYALGDKDFNIIETSFVPTEAYKSRDVIFSKIYQIVDDLSAIAVRNGFSISAVAIGSPGIVDPVNKRLINKSPNFHDWTEIDFKETIENVIKLPILVDNDANMAAFGELHCGKISADEATLYMTIGTGIGSALLFDGKIYRGSALIAGEIGHMSINTRGIPCWCGSRGCWEKYASMAALKKRYLKEFQQKKSVAAIFEQLLSSESLDYRESHFRDEFFEDIAIGIQNIVQIMNPRHIIIGGGAVDGHEDFVTTVQSFVGHRLNDYAFEHLSIHKATLGNKAALYGGLAMVFHGTN